MLSPAATGPLRPAGRTRSPFHRAQQPASSGIFPAPMGSSSYAREDWSLSWARCMLGIGWDDLGACAVEGHGPLIWPLDRERLNG